VFHPEGPSLYELAIQALSSTDRGYDLIAPKFDYTPFRTPDVLLERAMRELGDVDRAIDLCCGTGAGIRAMLPYVKKEIVGLDRSQGMLDEARRRIGDVRTPVTTLVQGDVLAHGYREEFDAATCFGAFGHILERDEPRFVASVRKALKIGGRFLFITSEMPPLTSPAYWAARGFNGVMRVRNAILKPEFVMYYLTFLLPRARELLEREGFDVLAERGLFERPFQRAILVTATRRR
jgi:ubiquinone/menaquinone biosynthesis C-methylase UbiE